MQIQEISKARALVSWECDLCHEIVERETTLEAHYCDCLKSLNKENEKSPNPFLVWKSAIAADRKFDLELSNILFNKASNCFFQSASDNEKVSRALYEYSTLMIAFERVQSARILHRSSQFDESLSEFSKACEIFRSTVRFAYMASYVSACATIDELLKLDKGDEDYLEACKNAIALLEQSKIALSFRDDIHSFHKQVDSLINLTMSLALEAESLDEMSSADEHSKEVEVKLCESKRLYKEYEEILLKKEVLPYVSFVNYFPLDDCSRDLSGPLIAAYPNADQLLLINVGDADAMITSLAGKKIQILLQRRDSIFLPAGLLGKGRVRIAYSDIRTGREYNEGCLSIV